MTLLQPSGRKCSSGTSGWLSLTLWSTESDCACVQRQEEITPPSMWLIEGNGACDGGGSPWQPAKLLYVWMVGRCYSLLHSLSSLFPLLSSSCSSVLGAVFITLACVTFLFMSSSICFPAFCFLFWFSALVRITFSWLRHAGFLTCEIKIVDLIFSQNRCWVVDPIKWLTPETSFTPSFFITYS